MMDNSEIKWGVYCHLAAFAGAMVPGGNIVGPLVIWLLKKDDYDFVDDQGKEVINFQITVMVAMFVSFLLSFVFVGIILIGLVGVTAIVLTVLGILKTSKGYPYRYPFLIKFLK